MKFLKACKELEDYPYKKLQAFVDEKRFELSIGENGFLCIGVYDLNGVFLPKNVLEEGYTGSLNMQTEWEIMETSVPWKVAFQAWADHFEIYCELYGEVRTYDYNKTLKNGFVCVDKHEGVTPMQMKNGTWYVEHKGRTTL